MNYLDPLYRQSKAGISFMLEEIEEDWECLHQQQHADHPHSFEQYSYPRRFNNNQLSLFLPSNKDERRIISTRLIRLAYAKQYKKAHSSEKSLLRKANVRHDFLLSREREGSAWLACHMRKNMPHASITAHKNWLNISLCTGKARTQGLTCYTSTRVH